MQSRFVPHGPLVRTLAWAAVVAGTLSWPGATAAAQTPAQVSVSGVFSSYTGGTGPRSSINGIALPGETVTNFGFPPSSIVDFGVEFNAFNQLRFTPAPPQIVMAVGDEFLLGRITYTNGAWSTLGSAFRLRLTTASSTAAFNGQVFEDDLVMTVTGNDPARPPLQNADFVYFAGRTDLGSIRVFEEFDSPGNNSGSVAFYGKIGSLIPTRFADAQGGATVLPSVSATIVPEPSAVALMAAGLGMLMLVGRRRLRTPR